MKKCGLIRVFYDGECAFCHAFVRFVLLRMDRTKPIIFSPIGGATFKRLQMDQKILPDSILVVSEGKTYSQEKAILFILNALGGIWKLLTKILKLIPPCFINFGYNLIARIRMKILRKASSKCPIMPAKYKPFLEN